MIISHLNLKENGMMEMGFDVPIWLRWRRRVTHWMDSDDQRGNNFTLLPVFILGSSWRDNFWKKRGLDSLCQFWSHLLITGFQWHHELNIIKIEGEEFGIFRMEKNNDLFSFFTWWWLLKLGGNDCFLSSPLCCCTRRNSGRSAL